MLFLFLIQFDDGLNIWNRTAIIVHNQILCKETKKNELVMFMRFILA